MRSSDATSRPIDFFISYSPANVRWASWIAWELEAAGHQTMLQAWDFLPGLNFVDFMDRGVSEAKVVIALLSSDYLRSKFGRLEWQTALRLSPDEPASRLVPVRIEDCPINGLLATLTYVDLVGVSDPAVARDLLMRRIEQTVAGRAKPVEGPVFPPKMASEHRRAPAVAPIFPAGTSDRGPRDTLTILHVQGPQFGSPPATEGAPGGRAVLGAAELQEHVWADLQALDPTGSSPPEMLIVTGNLTATGSLKESQEALSFLLGMRSLLGLEPQRVAIVPGPRDVNLAASRAYFNSCEADDTTPYPPYWPKWRHFARLFTDLYQGLDNAEFDSTQPWTLYPVPELRLVVAGLNSTVAQSHQDNDRYGWIGPAQAAWFAEALRPYQLEGWLRLGIIGHAPVTDRHNRGYDGLRDTPNLDAKLGGVLNLLIHGGFPDGMGTLPSGLPLISTPATERCQILELTRDGLTRLLPLSPEDPVPQTKNMAVEWKNVSATFSGQTDGSIPVAAIQAARDDAELPPSPAALLLRRIREVCEIEHPGARIRAEHGELPSLLISYHDRERVRQSRVAAHVGEVTDEALERLRGMTYSSGVEAELVYDGPTPPSMAIQDRARQMNIKLSSFLDFQNLLDLTEYVARQSARLASDAEYAPTLYVPQRFKELGALRPNPGSDIVGELLRMLSTDGGRLAVVLGDFGHGKTFALRELARRIPHEVQHLIPIFMELRLLDKSHKVEGLVAAHLADHGQELEDLEAFHYLLREGRIVLLFDGFDELVARVTYERATEHLEPLLAAVQEKSKIIISGRTQFFRTGDQVRTALTRWVSARAQWRMLEIEGFRNDQIEGYLTNQYEGDVARARARIELLRSIPGLLDLAHNPRMLGFIANLDDEHLRLAVRGRDRVTNAGLYREVLTSWLQHEEHRTQAPGTATSLTLPDLWQAVTTLAMRLWAADAPYLLLEELTEITSALTELAGGRLSPDEAAHAVGTGSLLVRTPEGLFGFIHTSVVEWLVADHIAKQLKAGVALPPEPSRRTLSDLTIQFLNDIAGRGPCLDWAQRVLADPNSDQRARTNAFKMIQRLRSPQQMDLSGARLAYENLDDGEFEGVNFTDADLSHSTLVKANLTKANLRRVSLRQAYMDTIRMKEADLTEADLSRARLVRADLRAVTWRGSVWTRAVLIDCQIDPAMADSAELSDAAVVSEDHRDWVGVEVNPAEIGVPYGFSGERGRLPEPLSYNSDGSLLAVGNEDGSILVTEGLTGRMLRTLKGHSGRVYGVVFGPGRGPLVTCADDGIVRFWNAATGAALHSLPRHEGWVWPFVLSPDGTTLVTGNGAGDVWLWDAHTGERRHELSRHSPPVFTAAFTADGALLVTGDGGGLAWVWDTATGTLLNRLSGHDGPVFRVAVGPPGSSRVGLLATGDGAGVIRIWDPGHGDLLQVLEGHTDGVYSMAFSPDGRLLASGATDRALRLWDPHSGTCVRTFPKHAGGVYWVSFSPQGSMLASGDSLGALRLWDPASGQLIRDLVGHRGAVWPFRFHPEGEKLATTSDDKTVRLWDTTGQTDSRVLRGHGRKIKTVRFDAESRRLASCGLDGHVRIWNADTGEQMCNLSSVTYALLDAVFNKDGTLLATITSGDRVCLWDPTQGNIEREVDVETENVWALAFSPNGELLATANDDDSVRIWNWETNREVQALEGHRGRVRSIGFTPDGGMLATACDDRMVRLWDLHIRNADTPLPTVLQGHSDRVYETVFSADGAMLLTAGHDGMAYLWDVSTQKPARTFRHGCRIWSAALSPQGDVVATAGDDSCIRLWDSHTGELTHECVGHSKRVASVDFSRDGRILASGGDDGLILLWDLSGRAPRLRLTLVGLPEGWVAFAADGHYKYDGEIGEQFWHTVGTCRFEPGELDRYLKNISRLAPDEPFPELS